MKQKISDKGEMLEILHGLNEALTSIFDKTATLKIEVKECTVLEFLNGLEFISETFNYIQENVPELDLDWFNNTSMKFYLNESINATQKLLFDCKNSESICDSESLAMIENPLEITLGYLIELIKEIKLSL